MDLIKRDAMFYLRDMYIIFKLYLADTNKERREMVRRKTSEYLVYAENLQKQVPNSTQDGGVGWRCGWRHGNWTGGKWCMFPSPGMFLHVGVVSVMNGCGQCNKWVWL